jgi:predicted dehydrogenase
LGVPVDRIYKTPQELAARERERADGAEAALVVTPNATHFEACRALLEAGTATVCDKPLAASLEEADALVEVEETCAFWNYLHLCRLPDDSGGSRDSRFGTSRRIRLVDVEYLQEWLTEPVETQGNAQAAWRADPSRAGLSGALGDIGTHAFQLLEYVTCAG